MKCPRCNTELEKEFYEKKIDFRCPDCGGRMMTISGLRALCSDQKFVNHLWSTAQGGYSLPGPTCTSCRKPMRQVTLPLSGMALELDVCCFCQQIWFDPSELERIPLPAPTAELPPRMREVLAMREIEMAEKRLNHEWDSRSQNENAPDASWKYLAGLLGMPVELDAPDCLRKPLLTWATALLCLVIFLLSWRNLSGVIQDWGFIPAQWTRHGGLTLLTSMFLHGGLFHLIGNLYFLLICGDNVEDRLGPVKYAWLLAASGVGASLLYGLLARQSQIPCVGASGFISGVVACYALCFPKAKHSFWLFRHAGIWSLGMMNRWLALPAWSVFGIWIVFQVVMAVLTHSGGSSVAYVAHVGGALIGVLFAVGCRWKRMRRESEQNRSIDDLKHAREL